MMASKRARQLESSDSDSDTNSAPAKTNANSKSESKKRKSDANSEDDKIDLTGRKFVDVREFRGVLYVDIREYYEDKITGQTRPGKKGIALNQSQWNALKEAVEDINDRIRNKR